MKKLILILVLALCAGCASAAKNEPEPSADTKTPAVGCEVTEPCGEEEDAQQADMSEYGLADDHVYINSEYAEILTMIEKKESAIIYIGRPTCPWCAELVPILNEIAGEYDQSVYYVFTRSETSQSEAGQAALDQLKEFLKEELPKDEEGNPSFSVPAILFLKNGEIQTLHIGTIGSYDAHERSMNEEERAEFISVLHGYFDQYLGD